MVLVAIALSLLIGLALGLLGGGGSMLTLPILTYALGVDAKAAIASSLLVVGVTSLAALVQPARAGNVEWRTGFVFGAGGVAGAFCGGLLADRFSPRTLLLLFAGMMVATSIAMFRGRRLDGDVPESAAPAPKMALIGFLVGGLTGLVGAGGGFVVVPALALLGALPMKKAVGTSLLVITMNSFAGYLGHARHVAIDAPLTALVATAAVGGALLGGAFAASVRPELLRKGFAGFVLVMALFQIAQEL